MSEFFRKIRFKKGSKTKTMDVTGFELGGMMERGWKIDEVLEVFDNGIGEKAFHRARAKIQAQRRKLR